jgi:hypothetical protein
LLWKSITSSWEELFVDECECYMGFFTSTIATLRFTKMQHHQSLGKAMDQEAIDFTSMVHHNVFNSSTTQK